MKKTYLLLALLLAFAWQVQAQKSKENPPAITRYKWDIATDLLWLVNKNTVPPSVFVRLNTERNGKLSAYRLRVGGNYTEHLNTSDTVQSTLTKTDLDIFISLGKEWQKQFNQFQLFYGADLFYKQNLFILEYFQNDNGFYPRERRNSIGISPYLGFKYFIYSRVSVSIEAHFDIYLNEFLRKEHAYNYNDPENWLIIKNRRTD